jgi:hypothetical protein
MPRALHGLAGLVMISSLGVASTEWLSGPDAALHHPVLAPEPSAGDQLTTPTPTPTKPGIRPERFGAVANDGHNDYRALQRAIDLAAKRGVPVRLDADSTYDSKHWLRLVNGSTLLGHGSTSVLQFHWRKNDDRHDGYYVGNEDQLHGNRHITVARLRIRGGGGGVPVGSKAMQTEPNAPAIRMRLVHGLHIRHVEISHAPGISMLVQGSRGVHIRENFIHNSGRDGINIGWFKRDSRRVLVEDNVIKKVGDDGVAIIGAPPTQHEPKGIQFRVLHNRILGWKHDPTGLQLGRGISVLGARKVLIRRDRIRRPDSSGILIAPSSRPDPSGRHPGLWFSKKVRVVHNNIGQSPTAGLLIKRSIRIHSLDNRFIELRRPVAVYACKRCSLF